MIVWWEVKNDVLWTRTSRDVERQLCLRGSDHIMIDWRIYSIEMLTGEWVLLNDERLPVHLLGTDNPELAVAKLNLLYDPQ